MKRNLLLFLIVVSLTLQALAQRSVRVTYKNIINGREVTRGERTAIESDGSVVRLVTTEPQSERKQIPSPELSSYIDLEGRKYIRIANMPDGSRISTVMTFDEMPAAEVTGETEEIAG